MPELPEVETIRRDLLPLLRGRAFTHVWVSPEAPRLVQERLGGRLRPPAAGSPRRGRLPTGQVPGLSPLRRSAPGRAPADDGRAPPPPVERAARPLRAGRPLAGRR